MGIGWHDADRDLRAFVQGAVDRLQDVLGEDLAGVVLHGSLAMGCFYPPKSDVDILAVSDRPLTPEERRDLLQGFLVLSDHRPILGDLELSVVKRRDVRHFAHPSLYELHYGENLKDRIRQGWIHRPGAADEDLAAHVMMARQRGIALVGPCPRDLLPSVSWQHYLDSILDDFRWITADRSVLLSPFYGVLNGCRVVQTLTEGEGTVVSKEEAALWALPRLPQVHRKIVAAALDCYRDTAPMNKATEEMRRLGGRAWDSGALLAVRDYAVAEVRRLSGPGSSEA